MVLEKFSFAIKVADGSLAYAYGPPTIKTTRTPPSGKTHKSSIGRCLPVLLEQDLLASQDPQNPRDQFPRLLFGRTCLIPGRVLSFG